MTITPLLAITPKGQLLAAQDTEPAHQEHVERSTQRRPGRGRHVVMAIPALMVLRHGQVAAQRAGAVPAASLRAWVEEVLGN
jgi:hypothetical protein